MLNRSTSEHRRSSRALSTALVAATLLVATGLPAAPTTQAASSVTLTFWNPFSGPDGPAMKNIVASFNKSHPQTTIKMTINPNGNYSGALTTAISAHRGPDMFVVDDVLMATYAAAGVIAPLGSNV